MSSRRIVVRPVQHAALRIPLVFTSEFDAVAAAQTRQPWCQINIVRHQQGLAVRQAQDKALVSTALVVIAQHAHDLTLSLDLKVAGTGGECRRDGSNVAIGIARWRTRTQQQEAGTEQQRRHTAQLPPAMP